MKTLSLKLNDNINIDFDIFFESNYFIELIEFNRIHRENNQKRSIKQFKLTIKNIIKIKIYNFNHDDINVILNIEIECNLINKIFENKFNIIFRDVD